MNMHSTPHASAQVKVADWSLWLKHISGDPALTKRLASLKAGETVTLTVGGHKGVWEKKADGKDGRPTGGLKPLDDDTRKAWFGLYKTRRGALVDIALAPSEGSPARRSARPQARADVLEAASPADKEAAWAAFTALRQAGWRFDSRPSGRDALHERGPRG
ncbi:hypothetical protein F1654_04830 [Alkalicaulis satelles]|uniref:Uncharacterized protein n=1 Tax=Alkalicaulis satelles TaxID=2609175 RepID=A0A5M6ZKE5_9PROT|nr:hypothetical protein [Alkalicaulis satelles]KAA5805306.1 hypothetical protein F1654_04830 [Alkalicaulis satelles]